MSRLVVPLLACLFLLPVASAQSIGRVQSQDASFGHGLLSVAAPLAFLDLNGNGKADVDPDEPVYWDLDRSATVNLGDIRLSPYGPLNGLREVGPLDLDVAKPLSSVNGWFSTDGTLWFADLDNTGTVSLGDVRVGAAPSKVRSGDADAGTTLRYPGSSVSQGRAGVDDANRNNRRDIGESTFLDLDAGLPGGNQVSDGDVAVRPAAASSESASAAASSATSGMTNPTGDSSFRALDGILIALAALNLAGLLFVVRSLNQLRGPPKNPFK